MGPSIISVTYSTVADTLTDFMSKHSGSNGRQSLQSLELIVYFPCSVICLPLNMLYRGRFASRQKVGLGIVFFLATIVIVVAIARAVELAKGTDKDEILVTLWNIIESTVCK